MPVALLSRLKLARTAGHRSRAVLLAGRSVIPCAIGRGGLVVAKREGDGGTPRTDLPLRELLWRADRHPRPRCLLPTRAIRREDAWCDDPKDRRYNRLIDRAPEAAEERLTRADPLYDYIIVLGWNDRPVRKGKGSAIFWHLARDGFTPTAGCVAVTATAMRRLLPQLARQCRIVTR